MLNEIANETSCNAVFEAFGYPKEWINLKVLYDSETWCKMQELWYKKAINKDIKK